MTYLACIRSRFIQGAYFSRSRNPFASFPLQVSKATTADMARSRSPSATRLRGRSRSHSQMLPSPNAIAVSVMTRGLITHAHLNFTGLVLQESQNPAGSGGFCDVYRGLSLAHGKNVAIKKFRGHTIGEQVSKFKGVCIQLVPPVIFFTKSHTFMG